MMTMESTAEHMRGAAARPPVAAIERRAPCVTARRHERARDVSRYDVAMAATSRGRGALAAPLASRGPVVYTARL